MKTHYKLFEIKNVRFIIRNKWSDDIGGNLPYISIDHEHMRDRFEFRIGLIGYSFTIIIKKLN